MQPVQRESRLRDKKTPRFQGVQGAPGPRPRLWLSTAGREWLRSDRGWYPPGIDSRIGPGSVLIVNHQGRRRPGAPSMMVAFRVAQNGSYSFDPTAGPTATMVARAEREIALRFCPCAPATTLRVLTWRGSNPKDRDARLDGQRSLMRAAKRALAKLDPSHPLQGELEAAQRALDVLRERLRALD